MGGSVREVRRGVWELRMYLGRDERGKVRHKHVTVQGGKREAARQLNRLVAELEDGSAARDFAFVEMNAAPEWGAGTHVQ